MKFKKFKKIFNVSSIIQKKKISLPSNSFLGGIGSIAILKRCQYALRRHLDDFYLQRTD